MDVRPWPSAELPSFPGPCPDSGISRIPRPGDGVIQTDQFLPLNTWGLIATLQGAFIVTPVSAQGNQHI